MFACADINLIDLVILRSIGGRIIHDAQRLHFSIGIDGLPVLKNGESVAFPGYFKSIRCWLHIAFDPLPVLVGVSSILGFEHERTIFRDKKVFRLCSFSGERNCLIRRLTLCPAICSRQKQQKQRCQAQNDFLHDAIPPAEWGTTGHEACTSCSFPSCRCTT